MYGMFLFLFIRVLQFFFSIDAIHILLDLQPAATILDANENAVIFFNFKFHLSIVGIQESDLLFILILYPAMLFNGHQLESFNIGFDEANGDDNDDSFGFSSGNDVGCEQRVLLLSTQSIFLFNLLIHQLELKIQCQK